MIFLADDHLRCIIHQPILGDILRKVADIGLDKVIDIGRETTGVGPLIDLVYFEVLLKEGEGADEVLPCLALVLLLLLLVVLGALLADPAGLGVDGQVLTGGFGARFHILNNNCQFEGMNYHCCNGVGWEAIRIGVVRVLAFKYFLSTLNSQTLNLLPNSSSQPQFPSSNLSPSHLFSSFIFLASPKHSKALPFHFEAYKPKKRKPQSMSDLIPQTSNLSDIYPDISQQLFNKHAKLLSELKNRFAQIYDDFEPEKYVIVNGVAKIIDLGQDLQVNFAMENGVTVLYRKTYKNEDIYINGNHLQEEVIINAKGKHIQGIHIKVDEIKDMIDLIRRNAEPGKEFYGGILYIHSNIGQSIFAAQECFMLGVFISLIMLHEQMERYNKPQLLAYLTQIDPSLSPKVIASLLQDYEMNKCNVDFNSKITFQSENQLDLNICDPESDKSIKTHQSNESIKILTEMKSFKSTNSKKLKHRVSASTNTKSNNSISSLEETSQTPAVSIASLKLDVQASNKLILCKLDLSNEQCQSYQYKMSRIKELNELIQQQKLNKYDIFEDNQVYLRASAFKDMIKQEEYQLLRYCQENRQLLNNLINHRIEFSQFIVQKHDLDIKYQIFDEEVVLLINQIHKEAPFLKNFCIIEGTVLLISMDKQYYAEIMRFLRRLFNDYKLSTYRFLQTKHKLNEDKASCEIGEIMFTTSPSLGCAIYNQEENLLM